MPMASDCYRDGMRPVFWICDVLVWIRIPDPYRLITDPDPALFINGFQDAGNKVGTVRRP